MSRAVEVRPMGALEEKIGWARALAPSDLLPPAYRQQPANLLLAAEYADTLGVPRVTALTGIHVIQGKPSMSADLMAAQVRRAGHKLRVNASDTEAVAQLIRSDDPEYVYECRWTLDRAEKADLLAKTGGNWQKYPAAMLKARAISEVVREGCSEVLFGAVYTPEELGAQVDESGGVIQGPTLDPAPVGASEAVAMYRQETDSHPAVTMTDEEVLACTDVDALRAAWQTATPEQRDLITARASELTETQAAQSTPDAVAVSQDAEVVEATLVDDPARDLSSPFEGAES